MNKLQRSLFVLIALVGSGVVASDAQAQTLDNWFRLGSPYGVLPGSGIYEQPYAMGRIPTPPYFALHPPVYYSHPVPRTYGHSPYAYPGVFRTPEIAMVMPTEIINPHVSPAARESIRAKNTNKTTARTITNPYAISSQQFVGQ